MSGQCEKYTINNLCVFCASSTPSNQDLEDAVVSVAKEMLSRKIDLVYGGGNTGLMGTVARVIQEGIFVSVRKNLSQF